MIYRTKDGDVLDLICHKYYGDAPCSVEAVYEANRGLADLGPVLPAGVLIELPAAQPIEAAPIRLWD